MPVILWDREPSVDVDYCLAVELLTASRPVTFLVEFRNFLFPVHTCVSPGFDEMVRVFGRNVLVSQPFDFSPGLLPALVREIIRARLRMWFAPFLCIECCLRSLAD